VMCELSSSNGQTEQAKVYAENVVTLGCNSTALTA